MGSFLKLLKMISKLDFVCRYGKEKGGQKSPTSKEIKRHITIECRTVVSCGKHSYGGAGWY